MPTLDERLCNVNGTDIVTAGWFTPDQLRTQRDLMRDELRERLSDAKRLTDLESRTGSLTHNQRGDLARISERTEVLSDHLPEVEDALYRLTGGQPANPGAARAAQPYQLGQDGPPRTGQLLGPEQRMSDYVRAQGRVRDDEPRLDAGKVMRGLVLGRWDGADVERRAMAEGTNATGGYLVPVALSAEIIDLARSKARVLQAGARVVPMDSEIQNVARQIADPAVSWRLENSQISQSGPTFDLVQFTARSLACITVLSRELLEDAKQDLNGLVQDVIAKAIALEIDRVALRGNGVAPQPTGLLNATGVPITSLGANGATPTYDQLSNAVQTVRANNFEPNAAIWNPRTAGELARLKDTQGRYLQPSTDLKDLALLPTNQVPTNLTQGTATTASEVYVGQFDQLWVGVRTELQLQVLTERYADFGQVGVLAWWRGDVQVAHPLAFNILTGVL